MFPIGIPPLRSRREDIPDLARRFCARFAAEEGRNIRGVAAEALSLLSTYDWPGNVRQLENAVFRAVVLADGDELTVAEFPQIANHVEGFDVRVPPRPRPSPPTPRERRNSAARSARSQCPAFAGLTNGEMRKLEDMEAETIRFALSHYRGQMSEIARRLGIGRSNALSQDEGHRNR